MRVREFARARVAQLASGDAELLKLLARGCAEAALEEWLYPIGRAGGVSFLVGVSPTEFHRMSSAAREAAELEVWARVVQPRVVPAVAASRRAGRRLPLRRARLDQQRDAGDGDDPVGLGQGRQAARSRLAPDRATARTATLAAGSQVPWSCARQEATDASNLIVHAVSVGARCDLTCSQAALM